VVRVAVTRDLPVSVTEGFDYITNVRNWLAYWPEVIEVPDEEQVAWSEPGDEASVIRRVRGRPTEMRMKLGEFRPYEGVFYRSVQDGLPEFWHERHFDESEGHLRYTLAIAFEPRKGVRGLIDRLFVARVVRRNLIETLDNLERIFRQREHVT
jgi:Polyketide cyclase / dehydrase and lipid transport